MMRSEKTKKQDMFLFLGNLFFIPTSCIMIFILSDQCKTLFIGVPYIILMFISQVFTFIQAITRGDNK